MISLIIINFFLFGCISVNDHEDTTNSTCKEYKIPEIDIKSFRNGNEYERIEIANFFDESFHNVGVVQLINHGILPAVIDEAYTAGKQFFHLSQEDKLKYRLKDYTKCGYTPMGALQEKGADYEQDGASRADDDYDLAEMYFLQLKQLKYNNTNIDVAVDGNNSMLNVELMLSAFNYISCLKELRKTLNEIAGLALHLENIQYFNDLMTNPELYYPLFVYLYYPEVSNLIINETSERLHEHTDVMTFTLVKTDNVQGLQIYINDEWYDAYTDDAILLFSGDAMKVYTNNRWKSTKHRVILKNTSDHERMTMSYAIGPDYDQMIQTLKCDKCSADKSNYEPRTVNEHFKKRFDDTFAKGHEYS